ncbi:hypothetical protein DCAR_0830399 [Daucus carota subsp. sativus]|uniref:Uncharacterized protein n=1 Tax=Daucus carota subsp. sativus TaxID=79200 RepID=A0AAF0XPL6_DAUCS|nr:hypothetical protein DCAR_0830399 [Daucus carota subsp. sativus]
MSPHSTPLYPHYSQFFSTTLPTSSLIGANHTSARFCSR